MELIKEKLIQLSSEVIKLASQLENNSSVGQDIVYNENASRLLINLIQPKEVNKVMKTRIKLEKGSITKRSDGRYMGRYRSICIYARSELECAEKLKQEIKDLEEGYNKLDKTMLLNDWFDYYVEMYKKPVLKESTLMVLLKNYNSNIRNKLGKQKITNITPKLAKDFIDSLETNNRKKFCFNLLTDVFDRLIDYRLVKTNVMKLFALNLEKEQVEDKKSSRSMFLTDKELELIFQAMKNTKFGRSKFLDIAQFIVYTGLRVGEACALTWGDIDFDNNTITINKSYSSVTKKNTTTKTKSGVRTIPLFEKAKDVLLTMEKGKLNQHIFKEIDSNSFSTTFRAICKSLNINSSPHSLRHTFASKCYEMGIDPKVVQGWLGHKSVNVTLDIYTQISQEKEQQQIQKINNLTPKLTQ